MANFILVPGKPHEDISDLKAGMRVWKRGVEVWRGLALFVCQNIARLDFRSFPSPDKENFRSLSTALQAEQPKQLIL